MRVVRVEGEAALIEHGLERRTVPVAALVGQRCPDEVYEAGIPYGVPWEQVVEPAATPEGLARELRQRNIWTAGDARANPQAVQAAIMALYGIDVQTVLRAAKRHKE